MVALGNNPSAQIDDVYEIIDKEVPGIKVFFGTGIEKVARAIFADYLIARVDNWILRLNNLYANIERWAGSDYQMHKSQVLQRPEELLSKYNIQLRNVPTLTILHCKNRIGFVPSALWVIGANGRVNVTTNSAL